MTILPAAALVLTASLLFGAALGVRGRVAYLLALYLLSLANIILTGYALGLFYLLNNPAAMLGVHAAILGCAYLVWKRRGAPALWGPFAQGWRGFSWPLAWQTVRHNPDVTLLAVGMGFFYLFSFVLGVTVPPNNYDSLSTHLARVGYWLQLGSYLPWPTPSLTQVIYPLNAQIPIAWSILFTGADRFVAIWQWLAALSCGLSAFGITRLLGHSIRPALMVALITLGFPLLVLQSSTPQTDLVTAAMYAAAVYLLFLGIEKRHLPALALMALAVGLGAGTKKSFLLLMPGLFLLAGLVTWQRGRDLLKQIWRQAAVGLALVVLLGSSYFFINLRTFGQPLGPQGYLTVLFGDTGIASLTGRTLRNTPRLVYQALDPSGLPRPFGGYTHKIKARITRPLVEAVGFQIEGTDFTAPGHNFNLDEETVNEESNAWYGPLSVIFLLPALGYALVRGIRQRNPMQIGLVVTFLLFFPLGAAVRPGWDPYQGRYFAPLFVTAAPLMAVWFERNRPRAVAWLAAALALIVAGYTLFYNPAKPTLGKWADDIGVWQKDRIFLMTVQHKKDREMQSMVARQVPEDATLGTVYNVNFTDYILFGPHFTRRIVPVFPYENLGSIPWLDAQGIQYLLVRDGLGLFPPPEYTRIDQVEGWLLYQRTQK